MLQQLRDNFKKLQWTLWLVIVAFFLGLFIIGTPDSGNGGVSGNAQTIASIGESTVQLDEFRRYYRTSRTTTAKTSGTVSPPRWRASSACHSRCCRA